MKYQGNERDAKTPLSSRLKTTVRVEFFRYVQSNWTEVLRLALQLDISPLHARSSDCSAQRLRPQDVSVRGSFRHADVPGWMPRLSRLPQTLHSLRTSTQTCSHWRTG